MAKGHGHPWSFVFPAPGARLRSRVLLRAGEIGVPLRPLLDSSHVGPPWATPGGDSGGSYQGALGRIGAHLNAFGAH